jgi:mRNA interferase RelE/StbE
MYQIFYKKSLIKDLKQLPNHIRVGAISIVQKLANDPRPKDCKKLRSLDSLYRIRFKSYRIIYQINDSELIVIVITTGYRKNIYSKI